MKPAIFAIFAFVIMLGACIFIAGTLDLMSLDPVDRFLIAFFSIFAAGYTYAYKELLQ